MVVLVETSGVLRLRRAETLLEGKYRVLDIGGLSVVAVRVGGQVYVFKNHCSHQGRRMEGGALAGAVFTCPHHAVSYDVKTGGVAYDSGYIGLTPVRTYPVEIRGGDVYIRLTALPQEELSR